MSTPRTTFTRRQLDRIVQVHAERMAESIARDLGAAGLLAPDPPQRERECGVGGECRWVMQRRDSGEFGIQCDKCVLAYEDRFEDE